MKLKILPCPLSVCKLLDTSLIPWNSGFVSFTKTEDELSLVCDSNHAPSNAYRIEAGWRAFMIEGVLDFSLIGILAEISTILAEKEISVFVVSTFDTDYILVKAEKLAAAAKALRRRGHEIVLPE